MAIVTLAPQICSTATPLKNPVFVAVPAADNLRFPADGKSVLVIKANGALNVTIQATARIDGRIPAAGVVSLVATDEVHLGPFDPALYQDVSGQINVLCSTANGTAALIQGRR